MQWIKTLTIFLALFLGGGASNAQPYTHDAAKKGSSCVSIDIKSCLNRTTSIKSSPLFTASNMPELIKHSDKKTKSAYAVNIVAVLRDLSIFIMEALAQIHFYQASRFALVINIHDFVAADFVVVKNHGKNI